MSVFLDTSVFLALLSADDHNNKVAGEMLATLAEAGEELVTTNYVLVETYALIQRRLGMEAVRGFHDNVLPALAIAWIGAEEHQQAVQLLLAENRRQLSLVDCSSFKTIRRLKLGRAFAFDEHFREQGLEVIP